MDTNHGIPHAQRWWRLSSGYRLQKGQGSAANICADVSITHMHILTEQNASVFWNLHWPGSESSAFDLLFIWGTTTSRFISEIKYRREMLEMTSVNSSREDVCCVSATKRQEQDPTAQSNINIQDPRIPQRGQELKIQYPQVHVANQQVNIQDPHEPTAKMTIPAL